MLPKIQLVQSDDRVLNLFQDRVLKSVNPVLNNPLLDGILLQSVALINGDTVVNHLLGRPLVGWFVTRRRAAATIYDKQDTNGTPNLTLVLNSSAAVTVDICVF